MHSDRRIKSTCKQDAFVPSFIANLYVCCWGFYVGYKKYMAQVSVSGAGVGLCAIKMAKRREIISAKWNFVLPKSFCNLRVRVYGDH